MAFKGRINIREIEKNPVKLEGDEKDSWIVEVLEQAAPKPELTELSPVEWAARSKFSTELNLSMAGSDFLIKGRLSARVPAPCSRCGDNFEVDRNGEFQLFVHRVMKGDETKVDEDSGDPDYVFLSKDEIDLVGLLAEQLMILEPMTECPARRPDGSCVLCGKNPQFAGQGSEKSADSPFAKLGSLKIKT